MIQCQKRKAEYGFTLVELSVVIAIIAVLVGSTLMIGSVRIEQQKVESTIQRIALIERALKTYIEINNRLPCPADPRLEKDDANYGVAAGPNGNCITGSVKAPHSTGNTVGGSVPVVDLALPADVMFDNWGRKFTFIIDRRHSRTDSFLYNHQNSTCGSIVIRDENDNEITSNGMYVLISHGKDGHGAYHTATATPYQLDAHVTNVSALDNAGITAAGAAAFDSIFRVESYYEDVNDVNNRFDDIVHFKSRSDLRLTNDEIYDNLTLNNKNTTPGWVYIPRKTLPSGKVVPEFEVMQYLASNDGNDYPQSVAGATPWQDMNYTEARSACQKLGYSNYDTATTENIVTGNGEQMEYDIISETQWLSIAHQALNESRNWVDSCYGDDFVVAGHRDNDPSNPIAPSTDNADGYFLTNNCADSTQACGDSAQKRAQRRTTFLPNGAALWDMSGNLNQWSYCDLNYEADENQYRADTYGDSTAYSLCLPNGLTNLNTYTAGFVTTANTWHDFSVAGEIETSTLDGKFIDLIPENGYNNDEFLGSFNANHLTNTTGVTRGSAYNAINYTGLFRIRVGMNGGAVMTNTGFRCVHNYAEPKINPLNIPGLEIWYDASDLDGDYVEEWEPAITENSANFITAGADCAVNSGCVNIWTNKASSGNYNALSRKINGATNGATDANRPTFKLNAINGRPAVNFSSTKRQWLDTHHGVAGGDANNGTGFSFNNRTEFTMFFVAVGTNYSGLLTGEDNSRSLNRNASYPHFVYFPLNTNASSKTFSAGTCPASPAGLACNTPDYVFMVDNGAAAPDNSTDYCAIPDIGPAVTGTCAMTASYTNGNKATCAKMGGISTPTGGLTTTKAHIATGIFKAGVTNGVVAYIDGGTVNAETSAASSTAETLGTAAACKYNAGDDSAINMKLIIGATRCSSCDTLGSAADVAEIIVYNRALTNKERVQIERYLSEKYDIDYSGPTGGTL